ncbi:MAG: glycosyltransferase, partial [Rhodothermales bacterium]
AKGGHALVHAHFGTGAVYALPYVRKHRLPFIVTFHGNDVAALIGPQRFRPARWRYVLRAKKIMQRADLMLAVSTEFCDILSSLSGRPDAVKLYRIGVDLARFHRSETRSSIPEIIMVGRFTEKKGHIYALRAFTHVIRKGRTAHLTLVGDGALEDECRNYVAREDLSERVTFAGSLPPERTAEMLGAADIALAPSVVARNGDREGSPIVVREAGACEVPVIGTRHSGIPESIEDGVTGYLVRERDATALADKLQCLIDDADLRRRMGVAARAKMEREFDLFKQVEILESHYDSVR